MLWRAKWLSSRSPRWMGEQQWEVNRQVEKGKSFPLQVPRATDWFRQQWLVVIAKLLIKAGIQENRFTRWSTTKKTEQRLQEPSQRSPISHYIGINHLVNGSSTIQSLKLLCLTALVLLVDSCFSLSLSLPLFLCVCAVLIVGWTLLESLLYSPVIVPPPAVEEQSQPFLRHRETAVHGLNINLHR